MVQVPREELRHLVHDLRNHLNSLLMNAGVVAAACRDQARLAPFIERIEIDGQRCAEKIRGLSERHL